MKNLLITLLLTSTVLFGQEVKEFKSEPNKIYFSVSPDTNIVYYSSDPIESAPCRSVKIAWDTFLLSFPNAYTWDTKANDGTFLLVAVEEHEKVHKKDNSKVVMLPVHIPPIRNGSHDKLIIITPTLSKPAIKDK